MQKKLIAVAIAAVSSGAFAQSNVQVYGKVDTFVNVVSADGFKSQVRTDANGLNNSRWGVKGSEDLGNNLKALFVLEYGLKIDQDSGLGSSTARQQMLGLTGNFGTVAAGRLQTTGWDWSNDYDVFEAVKISAHGTLTNSSKTSFLIGGNARARRANNALAYVSPNLNGFTFAVNYTGAAANDETPTANGAQDANLKVTLASAKYVNGPLSTTFVYGTAKQDSTNEDRKDYALGAAYDFGVAAVRGSYQTTKNSGATGLAANTDKSWNVGAIVPVSAVGAVMVSYATVKLDSVAATDNKANMWTAIYRHNLSKRTTAYTGYSRATNDSNLNFSVNDNVISGLANGATSSTVFAGLSHVF